MNMFTSVYFSVPRSTANIYTISYFGLEARLPDLLVKKDFADLSGRCTRRRWSALLPSIHSKSKILSFNSQALFSAEQLFVARGFPAKHLVLRSEELGMSVASESPPLYSLGMDLATLVA